MHEKKNKGILGPEYVYRYSCSCSLASLPSKGSLLTGRGYRILGSKSVWIL